MSANSPLTDPSSSDLYNEPLQIYFPTTYLLALPGHLCGERIDADTIYICKVHERNALSLPSTICWLGRWRPDEDQFTEESHHPEKPLLMLGICEGVALPRVLAGSTACENRSSIHILIYSPPAVGYTYSTRRLDLARWLYSTDDEESKPVKRRTPERTSRKGSSKRRTARIRHALSPIPEYTPVTQLSSAIQRINRGSMSLEGSRTSNNALRLSAPARLCGFYCLVLSLLSCLFLGGDQLINDAQGGDRKHSIKHKYRCNVFSSINRSSRFPALPLCLRWLRQCLQLPALWRAWRENPLSDQNGGSMQGLRLFHTASMIGLDTAVGLTLACLIQWTPSYFLLPLRNAYFYLNEHVLQSTVEWLMGSPAGFQMNKNLAKFVGTISLTVVNYWNLLMKYCSTSQGGETFDYPSEEASDPTVGYKFELLRPLLLACLGACGASVLLAFIIDLLSIVFFHIFFVYVGVTRLWNTNTSNLYTLFLLFRGKKYNVLRERVDAHPFDLEQLLLGAVFLALFVFLLPTVFVFYVCFMLLWLAVLLIQLGLWTVIMFFNRFPLYALVLSVTDIYSLPSGVTVNLMPLQSSDSTHGEVCYFNLSSHSLQSSEILEAFLKEMLRILPRESSHWLASVVWGSSLLTMKHQAPDLLNVYRQSESHGAQQGNPIETKHSRRTREEHRERSPERGFKQDVSFMAADIFTAP